MKRLLTLLTLLMLLPGPLLAASRWRTITAEWQDTPPSGAEVEGFRLYIADKQVCEFTGADTRTGDCEVIIASPSTAFTLTSIFVDGSESPHSAPFDFRDTIPSPAIQAITR